MIENVKKLFSYNWSEVFTKLKTSENEIEVPESVATSIKNGFILSLIYSAITMALPILALISVAFFLPEAGSTGSVMAVFGTFVVGFAIGAAILLLIMNFLIKGKPRNNLRYIVVFVLVAIGAAYSCLSVLTSIKSGLFMFVVSLIAFGIGFIAYANVAVGCIDFCYEADKE